ncbi:MAG: hypothetical protein P8179_05620 [Candidatus Thiodiazotropha sp.]|jgi:hypothetical protein
MKFLLLLLMLLPLFSLADENQDQEKSGVAESAKSVVSSVVKFGKELISGATDGVTEGRKSGESHDGATIVSNLEELEQHIDITVLGKTSDGENSVNIELGFKNRGENPVRIINIKENNTIIVLDKDGYATSLSLSGNNPLELTVPEQAAKKQTFNFNIPFDRVSSIRIWGKQYPL